METEELYYLVKEFFGYKAKMSYISNEKKEVACILYDSFLFKCNLNGNYGTFGGGIVLAGPDEPVVMKFLGRNLSLNSDKDSIKNNLKIVDDYCKMRLPERFLLEYDKAYKEDVFYE